MAATAEPGGELVLGPSDGSRSGRMVGWSIAGIVAAGAAYTCLSLLDDPLPVLAAVAGVVLLVCVLGFVAAVRHRVWVDTSGIHIRTLSTTVLPWSAVASVRLDRKVIRTPRMEDQYGRSEPMEGDVIISRLVLVAELRNGRRVSLPISVAEGTMSAARATELARVLDQLRRAA